MLRLCGVTWFSADYIVRYRDMDEKAAVLVDVCAAPSGNRPMQQGRFFKTDIPSSPS